jgi:hypothetical protein
VAGDEERHPNPEVPTLARRRTFTVQYKQEILAARIATRGPTGRGHGRFIRGVLAEIPILSRPEIRLCR